ncbi:C3 and PZP-like alpha-2-macroglobulin domain-containing protein 8 [Antedon mediterranea]|uniref:C3 and PZP-like alpha-2-macroglobulin domain-containing protein 8 n=1 Tax=Antedon mediterranea TaxID=105859 RepID=UPI003AF79A53
MAMTIMAKFRVSVFVLISLCCFCTRANANRGYLVTCPSVLRSTTTETISVTIFQPSEPVLVNVSLIYDGKEVSSTQEEILGKGNIDFKVPNLLRGEAILKVCGNCVPGNTKEYTFFNSSLVRIEEKGSSVFLQTDRPIYKPGQTVLIRAFLVDPDLRPKDAEIFAYVVDPRGSRMIQWENVEPMCCGIFNLTFPLSDQPIFGEWFIYAEEQGQVYNVSFEVKEYVLPRFHIDVEPPKYIVGFEDCYPIVISASYVYGQPVQGKLMVTSNVHGVGYFEDRRGHPQENTVNIDGSATVRVCPEKYVDGLYGDYFRGVLHIEAKVVASDGNTFSVIDESCPIYKQQLIHIKFSQGTKQHFKPGLPYKGKILVTYPDGSPADGVTIRVKTAAVQEEAAFNEEFVSRNGAVSFQIPVIEISTQMLWLEALVTAIDGKPVKEFTYSSEYLTIYSWFSPSKSHLLLSNLNEGEVEVGSMARIGLMSTMPCNFTLNYDIISRGRIVTSNSRMITEQRSEEFTSQDTLNTTMLNVGCHVTFDVEVTHAMAPGFQVVGYMVKQDREGVTDTVTIPVAHNLQNKVTVTSSVNETYPGRKVDITINSTPGSCVCILSVDRSVHLMKPNYHLTIDKVFNEMESYSSHDEYSYENVWFSEGKRKKRSLWNYIGGRDAGLAFTEAGLKVMTDVVLLRFHQNGAIDERVEVVTTLNKKKEESRLPKRETQKRSYFPDTWIWHCFNMSSTRKQETFSVHIPDTITTWVTDVVSMSKHTGLGIARQSTIKTYKPFFVEFALPYSVIRGEKVKIPITVYNYLDTCVQASVTLHLSDGIHFVDHPGKRHEILKYCMEPNELKTVEHLLTFDQLGTGKIQAKVVATRSMLCCGDTSATETPLAIDRLSKQIEVEAEGILRYYTHSVFFCPNERITISTPNTYDYKYVKKPSNLQVFSFACKAENDAHIALAVDPTGMDLYEIVLGGWQNTKSWITASKQGEHLVTVSTPGIVSWDEFRAFWITFENGLIVVGHGEIPSNTSTIMSWQLESEINVDYLGFSTGWGSMGEFRIWRKEDSQNRFLEVFNLGLPLNYIPGSEYAVASMVGDVMGPTLTNLHNLIRLPFGCGEQNMIHFAPNVYVMGYLERTHQLHEGTQKELVTFLVQGYQRQLTYKHNDGSFSAFGQRDSSGSMWLTAFVLKSFAQSRPFIFIDSKLLDGSKRWIIGQQLPDGSFPPVGRVLNKDIQGGVKGKVSLTAYVVIALLEAGVESVKELASIDNGKKFLEDNIQNIDDPYTAALTAYALVKLDSQESNRAVRILRNMAITQNGYTSWRLNGNPVETVARFGGFEDLKQTINSAEVEMTAYGLLTYTALGDIASSLPIVKWLSQQRNTLGGFTSTQDTCIALQALSEYASLAYVGGVNLTIALATGSLDQSFEQTFELNNDNSKVLQRVSIPQIPIVMFVKAEGEGCGLLQIDVKYNIPDPSTKQAFKLSVKMRDAKKTANSIRRRRSTDGQEELQQNSSEEQDMVLIQACARWLHPGSSNMAVLEVSLHTGLTADLDSLDQLIYDRSTGVKRFEVDGRKVLFYFNEIPSQCQTCINFTAYRDYVVGNLKSVPARIYDYYEPSFEATQFYNVSRSSFIARDPCDGDECNKLPDDTPDMAQEQVLDNDCNTLSNDCDDNDVDVCGCDRTCISTGTQICGSDNNWYNSVCQMEVAACKSSYSVYAVPPTSCPEQLVIPTPEQPIISTSRPVDVNFAEYGSSGDIGAVYQPEMVDYSSRLGSMYELISSKLQPNADIVEDAVNVDGDIDYEEDLIDLTEETLSGEKVGNDYFDLAEEKLPIEEVEKELIDLTEGILPREEVEKDYFDLADEKLPEELEKEEIDLTEGTLPGEEVEKEEIGLTEETLPEEELEKEEIGLTEGPLQGEEVEKEVENDYFDLTEGTLPEKELEKQEIDLTEGTLPAEEVEKEEISLTEETLLEEELEKEEIDLTEGTLPGEEVEDDYFDLADEKLPKEKLEKEEIDLTEGTLPGEEVEKEEVGLTEGALLEKELEKKEIDLTEGTLTEEEVKKEEDVLTKGTLLRKEVENDYFHLAEEKVPREEVEKEIGLPEGTLPKEELEKQEIEFTEEKVPREEVEQDYFYLAEEKDKLPREEVEKDYFDLAEEKLPRVEVEKEEVGLTNGSLPEEELEKDETELKEVILTREEVEQDYFDLADEKLPRYEVEKEEVDLTEGILVEEELEKEEIELTEGTSPEELEKEQIELREETLPEGELEKEEIRNDYFYLAEGKLPGEEVEKEEVGLTNGTLSKEELKKEEVGLTEALLEEEEVSTVLVELQTDVSDILLQSSNYMSYLAESFYTVDIDQQDPFPEMVTPHKDPSHEIDQTQAQEPTPKLDPTHEEELVHKILSFQQQEPTEKNSTHQQQNSTQVVGNQQEPVSEVVATHVQESLNKLDTTRQPAVTDGSTQEPTVIVEQTTEIVEVEEEKDTKLLELVESSTVTPMVPSTDHFPTDSASTEEIVKKPTQISLQKEEIVGETEVEYKISNVSNSTLVEHADVIFDKIVHYLDRPASDDPSRSADTTAEKENNTKEQLEQHHKDKKHHKVNVSPRSNPSEQTSLLQLGKVNHELRGE